MNNMPIICTACKVPFATWQDWLEHRASVPGEQMARYDQHTRRCLSLHEWAMRVLAEVRDWNVQEEEESSYAYLSS